MMHIKKFIVRSFVILVVAVILVVGVYFLIQLTFFSKNEKKLPKFSQDINIYNEESTNIISP